MQNLFELSREEMQSILEGNLGMQVYETDSDEELREALAENLDDECMDGVLCEMAEASSCKAAYYYQKVNGYAPTPGLTYEGTYPSVDGEPLEFCKHYLVSTGAVEEDLIRFFSLSGYWGEIETDFEILEIDSKIQVWRK